MNGSGIGIGLFLLGSLFFTSKDYSTAKKAGMLGFNRRGSRKGETGFVTQQVARGGG
jgi:hypothetical protein